MTKPDQRDDGDPGSFESYLRSLRPLRLMLRPLIRKYGKKVREALELEEYSPEPRRAAGRPSRYDADELREIWLYIEIEKAKTRLPVLKICSNSHMRSARKNGDIIPTIKVDNLRRIYCKANDYLKMIRDDSDWFRQRMGDDTTTKPDEYFMSEIEKFWRRELAQRLDRLGTN